MGKADTPSPSSLPSFLSFPPNFDTTAVQISESRGKKEEEEEWKINLEIFPAGKLGREGKNHGTIIICAAAAAVGGNRFLSLLFVFRSRLSRSSSPPTTASPPGKSSPAAAAPAADALPPGLPRRSRSPQPSLPPQPPPDPSAALLAPTVLPKSFLKV